MTYRYHFPDNRAARHGGPKGAKPGRSDWVWSLILLPIFRSQLLVTFEIPAPEVKTRRQS